MNDNFLFNDQIINPVKEIIAYFKEELKRELTEKDELNLELEKSKSRTGRIQKQETKCKNKSRDYYTASKCSRREVILSIFLATTIRLELK